MKSTKELLEIIENAEKEAITSYDKKRISEAKRHALNAEKDCGAEGRVMEILSHTHYSKKTRVAPQGQGDTTVKVLDKTGKIVSKKAENKTSGGRIKSLFERNAPLYVVYSMDIQNSLVKVRRVVEPRVIRTEVFLQALTDCGAIKNTNGKNPEPAIQAVSKRWYETVQTLGQPFCSERVYTLEELED